MTRICSFGWRGNPEPGIGRIVSAHGDYYHLVCDEVSGEIIARKKKSAFSKRLAKIQDVGSLRRVTRDEIGEEQLKPITGDFVRFKYNSQGESMITEILPRFSHFERKDPTARRKSQTLAVNFDTLFIMMSLNSNFSIARIKRYLDLAVDMGDAEAVVVVTKMDLRQEGDEAFISELAKVVDGRASLLCISALTGEGLSRLEEFVKPCKTLAFIGSSGVGKSTLVNVLAGENWMATQEIQGWSGKGRHTTTSRELVMLPSGAMVIDTPGIREIGRIDEEEFVLLKGESSHRYRK